VRERELDEFGSLFQRSVVPTIEVSRIAIRDIVVLVDFSDRGESCGNAARELAGRFGSRVRARFLLHPADADHEDEARALLDAVPADERVVVPGDPAAHLKDLTENERPSLIVAPAPFRLKEASAESAALGEFVDALLVATAIPTLLLRRPTEGSIFARILAKIPGGRTELIEQFSFAFALCRPGGAIRLLHVIDERRIRELAEVLEVAPGIDTREGTEELVSAVQARMDHLLRGAIRTGEGAGFDVSSVLRVGDPFAILPAEVKDATLLIVGSQASHRDFLASRAYHLIQLVPGLPVLAL